MSKFAENYSFMKKNVLYTVTKGNRPVFMPKEDANIFAFAGPIDTSIDFNNLNKLKQDVVGQYTNSKNIFGISKAANPFSKMNIGNTMAGLAPAAGQIVGGLGKSLLSNGFSTGVGEGISNVGSTIGGAIGAVNPIAGGIVTAASGLLGGLWNGAFGVDYNEDIIKGIKENATRMEEAGNALSQAYTNNEVLNAAKNMGSAVDIDYHDLGKTGFLRSNNALRREKARLDKKQNLGLAKQSHGLMVGANQADQTMDDLIAQNFVYANGGMLYPYTGALGLMQNDDYINAINNRSAAIMKSNPFNTPSNAFGDGGGIHISPSKKGTFTAAATKHGMGVQEFARKVLANKDDYSPAMVKKANFARNASKWHAFGGELGTNGTDWTNGLLYIDGGGTHQQNPLGGVPMGFDANGIPNLVEEGETVWNDYVFSNRMRVPKAMFHTLGLGGAMKKGITFADASKKLARESEQRPNDPISMAGLEASLSKLAAVQEAERMRKQMKEYVGLENMAAYGGSVNSFLDGGSLKWLKKNHPDIKHIEEVAKAMDRYIEQHPSRVRMKGDVVPYMNAYSLIVKGSGNLLTPREMPAENSPVSNSRINTGIIHGNEAARERHFQELIDLGLSKEAALDLSYPEPELKKSKSPTTQSTNEVEYAEQMDRRNRFQERMYSAVDDRARNLPEAMSPEYVSKYSNAHRAIQNARGISTPILALDPVSVQQSAAPEAQAALQGIEPDALTDVRTDAERNYLASFTPSELDAFNNMTPSQRQAVLRQASQETSARSIPSSGSGYAETSGVRSVGSRNNGINPYAYDNSRWSEFEYYNPQTRQYDEGYLNFAKNINQDWVNRILAGTYGDMSRYLSRNNGYKITPQEVGNLATDELYSDMHKAMQAAYKEYQEGIDPVTGKKKNAPAPLERTPEGTPISSPFENPDAPKIERPNTGNGNVTETPYQNLDTSLRYAPVVGNTLAVLSDLFNTPDYTYPDKLEAVANAAGNAPVISPQPIGDYLRYTPFDRMFYANQLQANARATDRALGNTASPSAAAGMLANAYNTNNSLGNLYRQAEEYNLAQRQQTADFNRKTNMFNSQMGLEAAMANARNKMTARGQQMQGLAQVAALRDAIDQQYSAARSANLTNLFNSLGNIGRENFIFNQIGNDKSRNYIYTEPWNASMGYRLSPAAAAAEQRRLEEEKKKAAKGNSAACGGKMKRK